MRRADRLFQLVQLLRSTQVTTAAALAAELQVSERTIYRDVQDLVRSGVPIQGEAGVGYSLPPRFELPPLMFRAEELEALALGARMVQGWADDGLARAARSALSKIEAVLPDHLASRLGSSLLFVPDFHVPRELLVMLAEVRAALHDRAVVRIEYDDARGASTARELRPLGLYFWGQAWTLAAWCALRDDFRSFRLDRIRAVERTGGTFDDEPGHLLSDFLARVASEGGRPAKD